MNKIYLFIALSSLLAFGCTEIPEDLLIGQWQDSLNSGARYYFSHDGRYVGISPIWGYFIGTYEVVAQDAPDKTLEIKIIDKIPGSPHPFHRRLKGKFSKNDKIFSGDKLSQSPMPFSLEYIDNSQSPSNDVIERVLEKAYKKLREAETAMLNNFKNLEETREDFASRAKNDKTEIEELKLKVAKLQAQTGEISAQPKEQNISAPETTNIE